MPDTIHMPEASRRAVSRTLGSVAAALLLVACSAVPFLPGRYDPIAAPVSMLAQLFLWVGVLLVPAGLLLLAAERWTLAGPKVRLAMRVAAVVLVTLVWCASSAASFAASTTLGVLVLIFGGRGVWTLARTAVACGRGAVTHGTAAPTYLATVPIAALLLNQIVSPRLTEFARDRAIHNAAPLIAEIERHRVARGRYPVSLAAVNMDINPNVIGVAKYEYESAGNAYNLFFELPSFRLGIREIVVYNPLDEQVMTSHRLDVLQLSPEQLALDRTRGHNALHDAKQRHWKYYWFD